MDITIPYRQVTSFAPFTTKPVPAQSEVTLMTDPAQEAYLLSEKFSTWLLIAAGVWSGVALLGVSLFAFSRPNPWFAIGLSILIIFAAAAAGCLGGFLFGVPKSLPAAAEGKKFKIPFIANTNFEKISDWFTTVLVGLGLVQFREFLGLMKTAGKSLGTAFGDVPGGPNTGAIYGLSMLIAGTLVSFLITYMWARTRLYLVLLKQEEAVVKQM